MGGGVRSSCSLCSSPDHHSSLDDYDDDDDHCSSDGFGLELEDEAKIPYQGNSSTNTPISENMRRRLALKAHIIKSYNGDSIALTESINEAKRLLLSYAPGSWIDKDEDEKLSDFYVPKATTLLVVGFRGSGKSSLINKISRVFECDKFTSVRAQVSYCSSLGNGTCFLHGYMIPRHSSSFCLFDTRGFSYETRDNDDLIRSWMTNGVRNGELVIRESDKPSMKAMLKLKIREDNATFGPVRKVNFVIFVVDGLSVLRSLNSDKEEDTRRAEMLSRAYNSPYLSFGDDKPVVVVTKGDLLSHEERATVRIYLSELLGVSPTMQIFDIPESLDPGTELAILDMLKYGLVRADKNLPHRSWTCSDPSSEKQSSKKVYTGYILTLILGLGIIMATVLGCQPLSQCAPLSNLKARRMHNHETLVNQTIDHPACPEINLTAQTDSFCSHHQQSETTRDADHTVTLDLSKSSTKSNSEPTQAMSTGQEQETQERRTKPKQQTVKPKTRKAGCKSRARKQQKVEDVSDPTINWEARKRLWLVE